ncbi:MAG: hypothetical protein ACOYIP_06785 [Coriobacteriales bacterium]|jgi:hypothetical protein
MKKKFLSRIAAAVAAATLCAGMCFAVAGCSQEAAPTDPAEEVRAVIAEGFDEVKTQLADVDSSLVNEMLGDSAAELEQFGVDGAEFMKALFEGFDYEIGDITVAEDGTTAQAAVTMKMKDLNEWSTALEEAASNVDPATFSMTDIGLMMIDTLKGVQGMTDIPITVDAKNENGTWTVDGDALSEEVSTQMTSAFEGALN